VVDLLAVLLARPNKKKNPSGVGLAFQEGGTHGSQSELQ